MFFEFLQNTWTFFLNLDGNILLLIQDNLRYEWLNPVMVVITRLGSLGILWIVLSLVLLINKRTRRVGLIALISLGVTFFVYHFGLKPFVGRVRPYDAIDALHRLVPAESTGSFPSGHAAAAFAVATVVFRGCRRWFGVPVLCLAFLISFSRLYVGVHYPSDVIAGALIGFAFAQIFFAILADRKLKELHRKKR